jgi:hypothetical protein
MPAALTATQTLVPELRAERSPAAEFGTGTSNERRGVMAVFNGMFPILSGKEDAARAWLTEVAGPRKAGFDAMQQRSAIARETLTLLTTPMGAFLAVQPVRRPPGPRPVVRIRLHPALTHTVPRKDPP